jgi:hypothetical protein
MRDKRTAWSRLLALPKGGFMPRILEGRLPNRANSVHSQDSVKDQKIPCLHRSFFGIIFSVIEK